MPISIVVLSALSFLLLIFTSVSLCCALAPTTDTEDKRMYIPIISLVPLLVSSIAVAVLGVYNTLKNQDAVSIVRAVFSGILASFMVVICMRVSYELIVAYRSCSNERENK